MTLIVMQLHCEPLHIYPWLVTDTYVMLPPTGIPNGLPKKTTNEMMEEQKIYN